MLSDGESLLRGEARGELEGWPGRAAAALRVVACGMEWRSLATVNAFVESHRDLVFPSGCFLAFLRSKASEATL